MAIRNSFTFFDKNENATKFYIRRGKAIKGTTYITCTKCHKHYVADDGDFVCPYCERINSIESVNNCITKAYLDGRRESRESFATVLRHFVDEQQERLEKLKEENLKKFGPNNEYEWHANELEIEAKIRVYEDIQKELKNI